MYRKEMIQGFRNMGQQVGKAGFHFHLQDGVLFASLQCCQERQG